MNKCHFTIIMSCVQSTLRNIRWIFEQIRLSEKLNKCYFTSVHDYHVVSSITSSNHSSEHSVNIRTNIRTNSAFEKIRLSDNFRFKIYAIVHCLNQIPIFYNFLAKTCFHHNILSSSDTQKILQNILLSAQWIVIHAKMIAACSLERRWIAEGTRLGHERQNS